MFFLNLTDFVLFVNLNTVEQLAEIINNSKEFKVLKHNKQAGLISHAYLFSSPDSIYLNEFVNMFAKMVLGGDALIENGTHPDFIKITSDKTIGVKDIEDIASYVYIMPYEADYKLYYIADASLLTEEAQNKLLKTIEEPPQSAIIVLGASSCGAILPTIISRTNKIELSPINQGDLINLLIKDGASEREASIYASVSQNNLTKAQELNKNKEYLNLYKNVLEMLENLNSSKDILGFVSKINLQKVSLNDFFSLTISVLRDIMIVKSNKNELVCFKQDLDSLERISWGFTLESVSLALKEAFSATKDLAFNANPVCVLDEFLLKMVEVKVKCKK